MFNNNENNERSRTLSTSSVSMSEGYTSPSELTDELEHLNDDNEDNKEVVIVQFAQKVLDFSSQYGSDYSISYSACNIAGRPSKFPNYGDFPETFAMRTYGQWWDRAPSRTKEIMTQTVPINHPNDFIVVQFEEFVFPDHVTIFETFNPGAVVKIWAFTSTENWICLWEETPPMEQIRDPREFTPTLKSINLPTRIIRIEFNHQHLDYFTEIDGVMLTGKKVNSVKIPSLLPVNHHQNRYQHLIGKGLILRKLESVQFRPVPMENHQNMLKDFLIRDLENFIAEIDNGIAVPDDTDNAQFTLKHLPCEILLKIFSYLDLVSLFRVSQTCRKLHEVAKDPLLYTEINLKPYWHLVNSSVMGSLKTRCKYVKKLDLSWCGLFKNLTAADFKDFMRFCGKQITHLRINSVKFLVSDSIEIIGSICDNLIELSLRNAIITTTDGSSLIRLKHLERIDFFRTNIAEDQLLLMIKNNPKLKHVNLGFGQTHINMDEVAITISQYNKSIKSIDMWKSHGLSSIGLLALANCTELEEVDFGWCLREEASPGDSLKVLLKGCPKIKKLFLASIRGLTDRDLENIANYCPHLEQLDLLGIMGISTDKCFTILCKCDKLQLLDLSFCDHLDDNQIICWRERFKVSIKRSFVRSDIIYRGGNNP